MNSVFDTTGTQPLILELLARRNRFEPKQLHEFGVLMEKAGPGTVPEVLLIKGGYLADQEIASVYAEDLFLPLVPQLAEGTEIDKELAGLLPEKLCTDKLICPMGLRDDVLDVAFVSPEAMGVVDELQLLTGLRINPLIGPLSLVEAHLDALYRANRENKAIGEGSEDFHDAGDQLDEIDENILNSTHRRPTMKTAGSSAWSIRFSSRRCATGPATSISNRLRTVASSGCALTACFTSFPRHRRPSSS